MYISVLEKDSDLQFPHLIVLKASAGSGKTHALTKRYAQFLLSDQVRYNTLRNILAITFSNNAAKEMKERILIWLKEVYFKDPEKLQELSEVVSKPEDKLVRKAGDLIEDILANYSDFQVKTIDSFMTTVYRASAIDLGYSPDFEIQMTTDRLMSYAFNLFLRGVKEKMPLAIFLDEVIGKIMEQKGSDAAYPWDPSTLLLHEIKELYSRLSALGKEVKKANYEKQLKESKFRISSLAEELDEAIEKSGIAKSQRSTFSSVLSSIRNGRYADLIDKGLKALPVNKPRDKEKLHLYEQIGDKWIAFGNAVRIYIALYALMYYQPYLKIYEAFRETMEQIKKQEGIIFIEDVNKKLSAYLADEIVPDVYCRIGETIYHYLIDEFQDTSPIQWQNLFPLIENSLSQEGSLFVVGDTKQAIYGFRNADYTIMKDLEKASPFSSAKHEVRELTINYRSLQRISDFNKKVFQESVAADEHYRKAAEMSGLLDFRQQVKKGNENLGYVEVTLCEKGEDEASEKQKIQETVEQMSNKGYHYSDIAVLTFRNENVVKVTAWLNEKGIPFISYSNLDIRMRKLTGETMSLLRFLDSPPDDLSFATFLLGDVFRSCIENQGAPAILRKLHDFLFRNRGNHPLYKMFGDEFPELWEHYFEGLFRSVGYLPLYDLVSEIYRVFRIFERFKSEQATAVRFLEVIRNFEESGRNNIGDFLEYAKGSDIGDPDWNIDVPTGEDAVRVMTIHKAKGLGFPVVIMLLYEEKSHGFKYIVHEEPDGVQLLKVNHQISAAEEFLEEAYMEEKLKDTVNRLNTLYVGCSRAEREMYIIGVSGSKKNYPIDILSPETFAPSPHETPIRTKPETGHPQLRLCFHHRQIEIPSKTGGLLSFEEKRRGDFIHRVLWRIDSVDKDFASTLEQIIREENIQTGTSYPVKGMKESIISFLMLNEIRNYFIRKPGRTILKEQNYSDAYGNLFRMDRVVVDSDAVTVIDYKTGSDEGMEDDHVSQVKKYMRVLRDVYPDRKLQGIIAYVDMKDIRRIV
jgi:ATP-dependent exoDNAse (exonuclease V) beta subunit